MRLQEAVGDTLRQIRQEQGLTLRDVSRRSHISIGHLSEVEMGKKGVSFDLLDVVANGLNITTADLMKEVHDYLKVVETWEDDE